MIDYLDRVRSGSRGGRARALWLPDAVAARSGDLWARGADRRLCEMRASGAAARCVICSTSSLSTKRRIGDSFLDAAQNARLVASAERYYRAMYYGTAESWNLRDRHMFDTLKHSAAMARQAVPRPWSGRTIPISATPRRPTWARRATRSTSASCAGKSSATSAALIGFGTDRGTVAAADDWDGPMKIKTVRPAHPESYERLCRDAGIHRFLLDLREGQHDELRSALMLRAGAGDRRHLPARDGAREPLFRRASAGAVRRLRLVRGDESHQALAGRTPGRLSGNLSIRIVNDELLEKMHPTRDGFRPDELQKLRMGHFPWWSAASSLGNLISGLILAIAVSLQFLILSK